MSLKDDLLRNRKIFEILTGSEAPTNGAAETRQEPLSPPIIDDEHDQKPFEVFQPARQKAETFSLERGRMQSRETGMTSSFSPPERIDFPELSKRADNISADPLKSLYHRLEIEARRSSQLLGEEE